MAKNKSYRKFIATGATAAMVATAVVPAALAASSFTDVNKNYKDAVDYLVENKIASGKSETLFGTTESITRGDAAVMIANALGLDTAKAPESGFKDLNTRVKGAVNALFAKKIINGKTATQFAPEAKITRAEMAKVVALAYELKGDGVTNKFKDVNTTFAQYVNALVKNEITLGKTADSFGATADVTRGEFALFVHRAEVGLPSAETVVTAVKAVNAKTITVTFNNAVNADTLKNSEKVDVVTVEKADKADNPGGITQSLSGDGKTLTLTATTHFKGDYTVKVPFELVKDTKGNFVKPVNQKVNVSDTTAPVLESATAVVNDVKSKITKITLSFDEVVKSIDTVKINGVNYAPVVDGDTATITVDLDASKSYEVTVVNATDVVNNIKDVQAVKLALTVDSASPSVTGVVATGENTATITLDKPLKGDTLYISETAGLSAKVGTFTQNIVTKVEKNSKNNKEYFVTFNSDYLFKNGNSDAVTLTFAKESLTDALENKNSDKITKTVSLSKDATAPTVAKVEKTTKDGKVTGFTATFSEKVQELNASGVYVVNAKGEILSFTSVASAAIDNEDATKVNFTFDSALKADKYSFDLPEGFVKDISLAKNKNAKYSFTVDVSSTTGPIATSFTIAGTTVDKNVVTVDFGDDKVKATGTGSALNPASYQVNGNVLPANTKIVFATVNGTLKQSIVNITLPAGFIAANDNNAIFRVTGVQTLDNKVNNAYIKLLPVTDNTAPEAKSFVATDLKELTVTYSEAIEVEAGKDVTDEIKLFNAKGESVGYTLNKVNGTKLVLTTDADATSVTKLTTVKVADLAADIKDAEGNVQKTGLTVNK